MASDTRRRVVPRVRTQTFGGPVQDMMLRFAERFRQLHPDAEVSFVYDPTHKPQLSKLSKRQSQGYRIVRGEELELQDHQLEEGKPVRVGDLVMMTVPAGLKDALDLEKAEIAAEELKRPKNEYYESIEGIEVPRPGGGTERAKPVGDAKAEWVEREFDINQEE